MSASIEFKISEKIYGNVLKVNITSRIAVSPNCRTVSVT